MDYSAIDTNVLVAQLGFVEVLGSAFIAGIFGVIMKWQDKRRTREREEDMKYRADREAEEKRLIAEQAKKEESRKQFDKAKLNLLFAVTEGLEVLLQAAHGDKVNGNVDAAIGSLERSKSECNKLVNDNAVENLS